VKADDCVSAVVCAAQDLVELDLGHRLCDLGDLCGRLGQRLFVFLILGDIQEKARFVETGTAFFPGVNDLFERGLFFEEVLGLLPVAPEVGPGGELVELCYPFLLCVEVKDAS
jgi:hypothetical protein